MFAGSRQKARDLAGKGEKNIINAILRKGLLAFFCTLSLFLLAKPAGAPNIDFFVNAEEIINYTNQARRKLEIYPLAPNEKLTAAALAKAEDMLDKDYFAHTSPNEKFFDTWIKEQNYEYTFAGENLARGFMSSQGAFAAWLDSPTHRKNILDPDFQEIGI